MPNDPFFLQSDFHSYAESFEDPLDDYPDDEPDDYEGSDDPYEGMDDLFDSPDVDEEQEKKDTNTSEELRKLVSAGIRAIGGEDTMKVKQKREFYVCRSKNCEEAKRSGIRCTITMMPGIIADQSRYLNKRKLCLQYSSPTIVESSNKPNWKLSKDKPGERTLKKREEKAQQDFIQNNPEFLEIT
jgi:hypothetical protein